MKISYSTKALKGVLWDIVVRSVVRSKSVSSVISAILLIVGPIVSIRPTGHISVIVKIVVVKGGRSFVFSHRYGNVKKRYSKLNYYYYY